MSCGYSNRVKSQAMPRHVRCAPLWSQQRCICLLPAPNCNSAGQPLRGLSLGHPTRARVTVTRYPIFWTEEPSAYGKWAVSLASCRIQLARLQSDALVQMKRSYRLQCRHNLKVFSFEPSALQRFLLAKAFMDPTSTLFKWSLCFQDLWLQTSPVNSEET